VKLDIAYAPSAKTTFWQRSETTWADVCAWVNDPRRDGTKDGPGYVLGRLTSNRREIALDADHLTRDTMDGLLASLLELNVAAVVYSTFSHTAEAPRLRILILPDRPLSPEDYWVAASGLMRRFGLELFDRSSNQHERLMYLPSVAPEGDYFSLVHEGPPLEVDAFLEEVGLLYDIDPRPAERGETPELVQHSPARPVPDEIISAQIDSAVRGLDAIAALPPGGRHPWPGVPEGLGWDLGALYMAERLIQAANSGGAYTIEQAHADYEAHAPASDSGFHREHKWEQAVKWVGAEPIPYVAPAEDFDPVTGEVPAPEPMDPDVALALHRLRVASLAQAAFRKEQEGSSPAFDAGSLADVLTRPAEPPMRIEGLMPWDSSTLLVAPRKTGKTTLTLNLALALLEGGDFLGRFAVRPVKGAVAILNYEVSAAMLAAWAHDHGLDPERFFLVNLRGRRNPLSHGADRALLGAWLRARGVESLIVDPFGRAFTGSDQNNAGEVGKYLVDLDLFARGEVGAKDLILTAHAGWQGERTRGSSALEDWPDSIVTMTRSEKDPSERYLSAMGRDVDVAEDRLTYDLETRTLSLSGAGSRKAANDALKASFSKGGDLEETRTAILDALREGPLSGTELGHALGRRDAVLTTARDSLIEDGWVVKTPRTGRGGGFVYLLGKVNPRA
jgi:hypothetical protein